MILPLLDMAAYDGSVNSHRVAAAGDAATENDNDAFLFIVLLLLSE